MSDLDRIPPSTAAYVVATAILAGITGYFIGQGSTLGFFSANEKEGWPNSYNVKVHRDSSDEEYEDEESEEEDEGDGSELANFDNSNEEVKLVLVVRTDLGMTKGVFAFFFFFFFYPCFLFQLYFLPGLLFRSHPCENIEKKKKKNH